MRPPPAESTQALPRRIQPEKQVRAGAGDEIRYAFD